MVGRLRSRRWSLALVLGFGCSCASESLLADTLPLARLRLYETGVGYFERSGTLAAGPASLPVPAGHLDDALKTLVVHAPNGEAEVSAIEFSSSISRGRARSLAGLGDGGESLGLLALLTSLRGATVETATARERHRGTVVEVQAAAESELERCEPREPGAPGCTPRKLATLVLFTERGELRRLPVDELRFVRPTSAEFAARFGPVLDGLGGRAAALRKELSVHAKSRRKITLGYVSETPVWRASYRLLLGESAERAGLQGWALIHNDTDEPWRGVQIELVNGRPDSFLYPLAAPRYARRALVTPGEELSTVPQLAGTTADALWSDEAGESFGASGLGLSGIGEGGGGRGEGIGLGSVGTLGHGGGDSPSSLLSVGNLAAVATRAGVEAGALFRFELPERVSLGAHASVLAPFLSETIPVERIALFARPGAIARSAVALRHDGRETFPAGTLAVFNGGGFAGESLLERMKPGQAQVVEFGSDLDVTLAETARRETDQARLVEYQDGALIEHYVRRYELGYRIENRSGGERSAFLVPPFLNNTKIEGARLFADSIRSRTLLGFPAPPKSVTTPTIVAETGLRRAHDVEELGARGLTRLSRSARLAPDQQKTLAEAARWLDLAARQRAAGSSSRAAMIETQDEIERLREHARAARGEAARPIVARLLAREDRASEWRRRMKSEWREAARAKARALAALSRL